jgi:acetylornithine deacetylase/succinyl-diaminopimelate desuccinylase-like protein
MDSDQLKIFIDKLWDSQIVPELVEYIRIPNKSPAFDPQWAEHGHMDRAVEQLAAWARRQALPGMSLEVLRLPGRTPLIYIDVPGQGGGADQDCVLLYGHLDKQPEMSGWSEGLGPWTPVLQGERLYGRGGGDDGYSIFAALSAIAGMQQQNLPHARCVVLIEACEESGSYDLPHYVDHLAARLGSPSLVICLDSGCANYSQLWLTTSLRGLTGGNLKVQVLREGVHSGAASGVVPSSFRILRLLLARVEDAATGRILPPELQAEIPPQRIAQARASVAGLGGSVAAIFPLVEGMRGTDADPVELALNRSWRPALSITGVDGIPSLPDAGNVLRPYTTLKLSLRLPPTLDAARAGEFLKQLLEHDPPYGAQVSFEVEKASAGWDSPPLSPWLERSIESASRQFFGAPPAYMGEGGSIPFMGMLGEKFPAAQFVVTGVLGPGSNAHGPNEFLHIPMAKRVTACVAQVLADHWKAQRGV